MENFIYDDGGRNKYFKGSAGDCVVRALSIFLDEDYKLIYDFAFSRLHRSPRDGVEDISAVYSPKGLIYEELSKSGDDYDFDHLGCDYILQYDGHIHAVIGGVTHDTHQKYNQSQAVGVWVLKENENKLDRVLYPEYEEERFFIDENGLEWVR